MPNDITGLEASERREWASMLRLLFDAQTVQYLSLYEEEEVVLLLVVAGEGV